MLAWCPHCMPQTVPELVPGLSPLAIHQSCRVWETGAWNDSMVYSLSLNQGQPWPPWQIVCLQIYNWYQWWSLFCHHCLCQCKLCISYYYHLLDSHYHCLGHNKWKDLNTAHLYQFEENISLWEDVVVLKVNISLWEGVQVLKLPARLLTLFSSSDITSFSECVFLGGAPPFLLLLGVPFLKNLPPLFPPPPPCCLNGLPPDGLLCLSCGLCGEGVCLDEEILLVLHIWLQWFFLPQLWHTFPWVGQSPWLWILAAFATWPLFLKRLG